MQIQLALYYNECLIKRLKGCFFFCRKFDPSYRNIYNRVRSGELGKVQLIRSTFRDTPLWLGAHSMTQTFLIHDIGILCWLNDSLPESLFCMASASIKVNENIMSLDMRFPTMWYVRPTKPQISLRICAV